MAKQSILLVILSVVAVFFQDQISHLMLGIVSLHDLIAKDLTFFFSGSEVGRVIQGLFALLIIPLVAGGLAALIFWLFKHVSMPHMMATIWIMWLIVLVAVLSHNAKGSKAALIASSSTASTASTVVY